MRLTPVQTWLTYYTCVSILLIIVLFDQFVGRGIVAYEQVTTHQWRAHPVTHGPSQQEGRAAESTEGNLVKIP